MADPIIQVENLGKRYQLTHEIRHDTLRDTLSHGMRGLIRRWRNREPRSALEEFWALREVSFEINRGEVVGIIGRNGSGKSTLLKVLSRITEPTTGRVTLKGRVASLLEVGTGFHPELSGRENIYLNGAILGMSRMEIRRKFDEIVTFAEVERFLDTPVKRYSSGMYVRLAFAVAAHLDPEILIVDEVLAVGDIAFQKKCLGKMESASRKEGRTVLFVSHNLHAVRQLCRSALLLADGRVLEAGPCGHVLERYVQATDASAPHVPRPSPELRDQAYITALAIETLAGHPLHSAAVGQPWRVRVRLRLARPYRNFVVGIGLVTTDGVAAQTAWMPPVDIAAGDHEASFEQTVALQASTYTVIIGLSSDDQSIQQIEAGRLDISGDQPHGYYPLTSGAGVVLNSMTTSLRPV